MTGRNRIVWYLRALLAAFAAVAILACGRDPVSTVAPSTASAAAAPAHHGDAATNGASARGWERPLLYRVVSQGRSFHLFGTIHVPDPRLHDFPPALEAAFTESDVVYTEVPLDEASQAAVAPLLALPPGRSLASVLPADLYTDVSASFTARGVPISALEHLKPWAVGIQLALVDHLPKLALGKSLDAVIYQRALSEGKRTRGLETIQEQTAIFNTLTLVEEIEMLRLALEFRNRMRAAGRDAVAELLSAYVAGDDAVVAGLVREGYLADDALSKKLMKRLLTDRNKKMVDRIVALTGGRRSTKFFFAVGAGHIVGDDGIVALLEQRGFKAERVFE